MLKVKNVPLICLRADKDIIVRKETKKAIKEILEKNYSKNTYYFSKTERLLYMYLMFFFSSSGIKSLKSRFTVDLLTFIEFIK